MTDTEKKQMKKRSPRLHVDGAILGYKRALRTQNNAIGARSFDTTEPMESSGAHSDAICLRRPLVDVSESCCTLRVFKKRTY
jgi:hypothetical protein